MRVTGIPADIFWVLFLLALPQVGWSQGISRLLWKVHINNNVADLVVNRFPSQANKDFPLSNVRVKKLEMRIAREGGRVSPHASILVAPLAVNADGTFAENAATSSSSEPLTFVPEAQVSMDLGDGAFVVLNPPAERPHLRKMSHCFLNVDLSQEGTGLLGWIQFPGTSRSVVRTDQATFFYGESASVAPGPYPLRPYYTQPVKAIAVAPKARRLAGITTDGYGKSGVVVLAADGHAIYQPPVLTPDVSTEYSQVYLTPDGRYLSFTRSEKVEGRWIPEYRVLDLQTGESAKLAGIEGEIRYYAGNGSRFVAVVPSGITGDVGEAYFYDNTEPLSPQLLWKHVADGLVISGAVNENGSLVALQVQEASGMVRVDVMNSAGQAVDAPLYNPRTEGLQWEAPSLLFVGVQRHPLPAGIHYTTTQEIDVFDFSSF